VARIAAYAPLLHSVVYERFIWRYQLQTGALVYWQTRHHNTNSGAFFRSPAIQLASSSRSRAVSPCNFPLHFSFVLVLLEIVVVVGAALVSVPVPALPSSTCPSVIDDQYWQKQEHGHIKKGKQRND